MAAGTNLMDMPQEILVMILRAYFAGVEVNLIHPDSRCWDAKKWQWTEERPQPRRQNFLSPLLANKTLHSISSELYFEHATFHFNKKQQARLYQKAPTDQSKKFRYVSGFLDPLVDGEFAKKPVKETFPELQLMVLKASMGTDTYGEINMIYVASRRC